MGKLREQAVGLEKKEGAERMRIFPLRLSKEESRMLKEKADGLGLDRASFLRMLIKTVDVSRFQERLWGRGGNQGEHD